MWVGIPAPPAPTGAILGASAAVCAILGLALAVRGLWLARPMMGLIGLGAGFLSGRVLASFIPLNAYLLGGAAAVAAGLFAFVLARFLWGVLLGAMAAALALALVMHFNAGPVEQPPAWNGHEFESLAGWLVCLGDYLYRWFQAEWKHAAPLLTTAMTAPVAVGLVTAAILPRTTTVLATALAGAVLAVGGAWVSVWTWQAAWAESWARAATVPTIVAAGVTAVGMLAQGWRVRRTAAKAEAKESDKGGSEGSS